MSIEIDEIFADALYRDYQKTRKYDNVSKADTDTEPTASEQIEKKIEVKLTELISKGASYPDQRLLFAKACVQVRDENPLLWREGFVTFTKDVKAAEADTGDAAKREGKLTAGEKIKELIAARMDDLKSIKDPKQREAEAAKRVREENPAMWKQREFEQHGPATPSLVRRAY